MRSKIGVIPPGSAVRRFGLLVLSAAVAIAVQIQYGNFLTLSNTLTTLNNVATLGIAALGAAALLIARRVDLSIAGELALLSTAAAFAASKLGDTLVGTGACVVIALAGGWALGFINGWLVKVLQISPLIVTIATGGVYIGAALAITGGLAVGGIPSTIVSLGTGLIAGIPIPLIISVIIFSIGSAYFLASTTGLRVYAIGGNEVGAARAGVPVDRIVSRLFCVQGFLVGIVALIEIGQVGAASPGATTRFEFAVLTAVLLGGVLFTGGSGRPAPLLFGVITIGVVNAALVFMGVQDWWSQIVFGLLLLTALGADQHSVHRRERQASKASPEEGMDSAVELIGGESVDRVRESLANVGAHEMDRQGSETSNLDFQPGHEPIFRAQGVELRYGAIQALRGVDLDARAGQITCLVGDNGAGKSSLVKVLSGEVRPTAGRLIVEGRQVEFDSPLVARQHGIETVYQDLSVCPNLNVAHNVVLGMEPSRGWPFRIRDDNSAIASARKGLERIGTTLKDYDAPVQFLSGGQRQAVAIARVLHGRSRVAIFDEPTAALGVGQTQRVLNLIRGVARGGVAVILVTHDIDVVLAVADRVVALRLGEVSFNGPAQDLTEAELSQFMSGVRLSRTPEVQT